MVSDKKREAYRVCNKRYYERHKKEILEKKEKIYCECCKKTMYKYYFDTKHKNLSRHIRNFKEQCHLQS